MTSLDEDFCEAFVHYRAQPVFAVDAPFDEGYELNFGSRFTQYLKLIREHREPNLVHQAFNIAGQIELPPDVRQIRAIPAHLLEDIAIYSLGLRQAEMVRNNVHTVILLNATLTAVDESLANQMRVDLQRQISKAGLSDLITVAMYLFPVRNNMGTIRGLLNDACLIAANDAGIKDPIIISSDVDILDVSPSYFDAITDHFTDPRLDVLSGPIYYGYSPEGQEFTTSGIRLASPELVLGNRVFAARRAMMLMGRLGGGRLFTTEGPNSVFRGAAMCAAGGYDYTLSLNEDGMMGNAIFSIRDSSHTPYPSSTNANYEYRLWIATDPRRTLRAVSYDQCIRNSWRYIHFSEQNGHDINLKEVVDRYQRQNELLQISDMRFQLDEPLSGKLRDRVVKIFLRSVVDTAFGPGDLKLYSRYFGIIGENIAIDNVGGNIFATPDLHSAFQRV